MDHVMQQGRPTGAGLTRLTISATLHCPTGCAIGQVLGMVFGPGAACCRTLTRPPTG